MTVALDQQLATLWNRSASVAQLRDAAEQARGVVRGIDIESESAPQREAQILAGMASPGGPSMDYVLKALASLDDESASRMLTRKVATALAAALEVRAREIEAREAARDPAEVRCEQEQARRETEKEALFARIPVLFRSDYMVTKFGKAAYSRTPPPQGRQVSYVRTFDVPRVLGQSVMTETKLSGHWPPKYGDVTRIEWPNSEVDEDEKIVGPLRLLCQESSVSEDEVAIALERAQGALLGEFARVCAAIRSHYPNGLPRFIALPSLGPRAMAAE
jgi:hypothetical protein